jgi:ubiquinone/menaquinone biosynthesis C-methylase UbiE
MQLFTRRPAERVVLDQELFEQSDFAAEYNTQVGKSIQDPLPILDYVTSQIAPHEQANVLEIGPGPGWIGIRLALSLPQVRVTGIDVSQPFVDIANQNSSQEGVADRVTFTLGSATDMSQFADDSFDVVFSFQSLHYWDSPERAFDEIARVLKPTGSFCIGDDRRDMNWRGRLIVLIGRQFLSRRVGNVWARSISGCLTSTEAANALQRSKLRDRWQMAIRPRAMLITSKPRN